eukprot:gene2473-4803_t
MDASQLAQVESLCEALYNGSSQVARSEAQLKLLTLQSSADYIPQCQFILDNSSQPFAQLLASTSLEVLITEFWNNFNVEQKLEIRNYVLNYLANHAGMLQDFVTGSLCKLACRITKLGWFDSAEHREIIEEVTKCLQHSIDLHIVGLRLLNALVEEMNVPTTGRTLTHHRKTAVSFRDHSLFQAFQISITTLRHLQANAMAGITPEQEVKMANLALTLATDSLSFDFIGTNPEESAEDVGTVQVPSSWRPIVQDTLTMQLFFDYYNASEPPRSAQALQALVQLSSIRRSLFASEKERTVFLQALMTGIQEIMRTKKGLEHVENYHEFCRLLGRLKASYQLSELVKTVGFSDFLSLAGDFTIKSLQNWQYSMNSIHYLLALWGRLVAALPYLRPDATDAQRQSQMLKSCVLQVVESYINTMLDSVEVVLTADGNIEDPLEDEGSLREQMDRLPVIARLQYDTVAQYLMTLFENALNHYEKSVQITGSGITSAIQHQLKLLEGRMTWLTYMVGAVIGAQATGDARKNKSEQIWDGQLSRCVFRLVQLLDYRLGSTGGQGKCDSKLEIGILNYFKSFKKVYMMDSVNGPLSVGVLPGGSSPSHPLLSLALNYASGQGKVDGKDSFDSETMTVFDAMGVGDMPAVMNIIVNKICNNIRFWNRSDAILEQTLEVFVELVSSYSSSKALLGLETVNFLVHNHTGTHFPFLGYGADNKYRITFYSALSRLVFAAAEDLSNNFDTFIEPNVAIISQLSQTSDLRDQNVRIAIIGALRDLRGIAAATHNKRTYGLLFDALYPASCPLLIRIAEVWYDDPTVITALLKFMQEFVHNKGQRVVFDQSSANGILLFRETSNILCAYGSRVLQLPVRQDIYMEKYKGIRLMLNTLVCALSGGYVNFGVFSLYNDKALQNALDVSLQLCLQIPLSDILAYMKLSKAYYAFLEVLYRNHLEVLSGLDSVVFIQLVKTIHEGLQSSELTVCALCASSVDHIATYMFLNQNKEKPTVQLIRTHMASEPEMLNQLMATLFNSLLFATHANHWAVTRPMLSLMLASESSFTQYQDNLIATQSAENQERLREEFAKLATDFQRSVEVTNRDRFTQKLTMFRLNVRSFLTF